MIHQLEPWELVDLPPVQRTNRRFTDVHLLSGLRTRDFNLCSPRHSLNLSLVIIPCHELANAVSASVVMRNLRIVHARRQLRACLTLVGVSTFHEISLRDVPHPISFRNGRHHDHRCNALICLCHRYHKSREIPLIRSQLPRNSNTRCTEHAIPSLVFHHSRNSRSPLHTVWREKDRGTRSLVMSYIVDTAQHPLVSASHCTVLTMWSEMH